MSADYEYLSYRRRRMNDTRQFDNYTGRENSCGRDTTNRTDGIYGWLTGISRRVTFVHRPVIPSGFILRRRTCHGAAVYVVFDFAATGNDDGFYSKTVRFYVVKLRTGNTSAARSVF